MMAAVERRPPMKTLILILCAVAICFGAYAAASTHAGVWTAEVKGDHLQVTVFQSKLDDRAGDYDNRMGFDVPLTELTGVTRGEMTAEASNVKFVLTREAGVLTFDGRFSEGSGAGHFDFRASEGFVHTLRTLGYGEPKPENLLIFTVENLTIETVRGLRSLGYQLTDRELVEVAIFGITPQVVKEYGRFGYANLAIHDLVELRIGHVDANYLQGMHDLGFTTLSAREAANAGILGVTPAYVREMRAAGVEATSLHELTDLRVGRITPARIEEYRRAGYPGLTPRQLSELGIQGVTPDYIEEMRQAGYDHLTVKQLINAKIFGVTADYIKRMSSAGYSGVPLDKIVQLKMSGAGDLLTRRR
jgi:hypothetical protein